MPADEAFERRIALEIAARSRDRHGVQIGGTCRHCPPDTVWPCVFFVLAHRVLTRLTTTGAPAEDTR